MARDNYPSAKDVPDEVIIKAFMRAETIRLSVRSNNWIGRRSIALPGIGWWLPLSRVLPLLSITPQMLRPVFNRTVEKEVPRAWPFRYHWFGLNRRTTNTVILDTVAEEVADYMELGSFPIDEVPLQKLARVLGKKIDVWREDESTGEHQRLYYVTPDEQTIMHEIG